MGDRLRTDGRRPLTGEAAEEAAAEEARRRFVTAETRLMAVPSLPEISLHLADDATALWSRSEDQLGAAGAPLPFWAFAWAGGRGLARFVLDSPDLVRGRRVLDFATGSGLVAIAAAKAGAALVEAVDIDPFAVTACRLNAEANGAALDVSCIDRVGSPVDADLVLCGDVFYDRAMTAHVLPWMRALAARGTHVLVGDPGRRYCPQGGIRVLATLTVPTEPALEDAPQKRVRILAIDPH